MIKKNIDSRVAEESLISSLIYKPDKIVEVIDVVNPSIFSVVEFGNIYKCIIELYKEDIIPDEVTIINKACSLGFDITPELVKKLANSRTFVTKKQIKQYCNIIKASSFKRKTLDLCDTFMDKAKDINDPEKIVNDFFTLAIDLSDKIKAENHTSQIDIDVNNIMTDIDFRYNNPNKISGIPLGYPTIDKYLDGACEGEVWTIAGANSHGKSYFAQQTTINIALWLLRNKDPRKILFFSLEMTREQIESRLMSMISGINSKYFKNPKLYFIENNIPDTPENFEKFKENIRKSIIFLNSLPIIIDDSSTLTAEEISAKIKKYILRDGVAIAFIDYVGLVNNDLTEEYLNISHTYKVMKQISKDTKVPIMILNQYLKDIKNNSGSGLKPSMYNLQGGKSALDGSHKILHIWRADKDKKFIEDHPEYLNKIVVFSDKNRNAIYGDLDETFLCIENGKLQEVREIKKRLQNVVEKTFENI